MPNSRRLRPEGDPHALNIGGSWLVTRPEGRPHLNLKRNGQRASKTIIGNSNGGTNAACCWLGGCLLPRNNELLIFFRVFPRGTRGTKYKVTPSIEAMSGLSVPIPANGNSTCSCSNKRVVDVEQQQRVSLRTPPTSPPPKAAVLGKDGHRFLPL
jgi:hypothetical protein